MFAAIRILSEFTITIVEGEDSQGFESPSLIDLTGE